MITEQQCRKCDEVLDINCFGKDKTMKFGYKIYCKECRKIESKNHFIKNKDNIQSYNNNRIKNGKWRKWYNEYITKPEVQTRLKKYRRSDRNKEIQKNYAKSNKHKILANTRKRQAKKRYLLHVDHDKKIEIGMYSECKKLEIETGYKWNVDHIYPLELGGPHWHKNLQVIPAHYNFVKGIRLDYENEYVENWLELPDDVLSWILTKEAY